MTSRHTELLQPEGLMVFTGNSIPKLADSVSKYLNVPLGKATVGRFSDGETMVEILENVRGKDVFILQSTCAPTNDHLMELMVMADALKRASAGRITAAIPYFGYARQDRRVRSSRVAISAKVVANMQKAINREFNCRVPGRWRRCARARVGQALRC
jgi:ribose-phosphate pyrophosphokinase